MRIVNYQCTSLNRIKYLCRMETQRRHITRIQNGSPINLYPECMSRIIDNLQSILILDTFNITRMPIHMNRHDGCCIRSDSCFYLTRIKITGYGIYIHKYRFDTTQPQRMCSGNKAKRSSYHFPSNTHCL